MCVHWATDHSNSWWRHQMETFSALLATCAGKSPVPVNYRRKGQWRGALLFFFYLRPNERLSKQSRGCDLRRHRPHYDVIVMIDHWVAQGQKSQWLYMGILRARGPSFMRPTDSADMNMRLQLSDTSSIPPMHGGFLLGRQVALGRQDYRQCGSWNTQALIQLYLQYFTDSCDWFTNDL